MTQTNNEITKEQIEQYRKQRLDACVQAIQAILQQYDCNLIAAPQITNDGRITAIVRVEAK